MLIWLLHAAGADLAGSVLLNINTASAAELEALPAIGPVTAQAIVDYRTANGPFRTVEEITEVKGIGAATLEKIQALIAESSASRSHTTQRTRPKNLRHASGVTLGARLALRRRGMAAPKWAPIRMIKIVR